MPTNVENKCKCGRCRWGPQYGESRPWSWWYVYGNEELLGVTFCPYCGCFLDDNGFAYEMVRVDSVVETDTTLAQEWSEDAIANRIADPLLWIRAAQDALSKAAEALEPADEGSDDDE